MRQNPWRPAALALALLLGAAQARSEEPDRPVLAAFVAEPLRFDPFCFSGARFPDCRFERPERVAKLVGPFTLATTFYDAQGKEVTEPGKTAGRYAAVVEIRRPGRVSKRFFTLYHLEGNGRVGPRVDDARLTLPRGTGLAAAVLHGQQDDVDGLLTRVVSDAFKREPAGAALLAGLHDLTSPDDRASYRERQWWVDFRRRYYGYDKAYPRPFVCPQSLAGPPALELRAGAPADAGLSAGVGDAIDKAAQAWLKENDVGFALCVARRGVVLVNKGYGEYQGQPVTPTTPSILASLTKFLNALLLLEFVDQGYLDLDEPVARYVPALRGIEVRRPMTFRDLYLHTCGLTGHDGDTWPDLEEIVADLYPALEVGVRHEYQGMGHALASKIMEDMSGEALPYLYQKHLFGPLGCTQTRADLSSFGSSGIALDLAKIGQLALNGGAYGTKRYFSPPTLAKMLPIPGKDRPGADQSIRWGVGIKQLDSDCLGPRAFGHSGATGSFLVIDPSRDLVIAQTRMSEGKSYQDFLKQKGRFFTAVTAALDTEAKR